VQSAGVAAVAVALILAAAAAGSAGATPLRFSTPKRLPGSPPKGDAQGGEPSAIFDQGGKFLYLAAPGGPGPGGDFWRSTKRGRPGSFSKPIQVGSSTGGGDSDLAVGYDKKHTVYQADLEDLAASDLCLSTNHGRSFSSDCESGMPMQQIDPAADRPWLNTVPGKPSLIYDTYDGLAFGGGAPEVAVSTNRGQSFTQCGQVLQPGTDAFTHFSPSGAAENSEVIGKPAVGRGGSLYVPFTEPHHNGQSGDPDPTPGNLYLGIARGGCSGPTSTFENKTIWQNDKGAGSDFVTIFPTAAADRFGDVYILAAGRLRGSQHGQGVYLFVSRDDGHHFSRPIRVNGRHVEADQLPAVAAGKGRGEVLIGWYASRKSPDPTSDKGRWRYRVAQTFDFGKSFRRINVTHRTIHYGNICNLGVLCGAGADRTLLDFTTVAVNPRSGCGFAVFGGDPYNRKSAGANPAAAYTAIQKRGPCLTKRNAGRHYPRAG
jgi:hypothetical protein